MRFIFLKAQILFLEVHRKRNVYHAIANVYYYVQKLFTFKTNRQWLTRPEAIMMSHDAIRIEKIHTLLKVSHDGMSCEIVKLM